MAGAVSGPQAFGFIHSRRFPQAQAGGQGPQAGLPVQCRAGLACPGQGYRPALFHNPVPERWRGGSFGRVLAPVEPANAARPDKVGVMRQPRRPARHPTVSASGHPRSEPPCLPAWYGWRFCSPDRPRRTWPDQPTGGPPP
jgi:hypothetical protein